MLGAVDPDHPDVVVLEQAVVDQGGGGEQLLLAVAPHPSEGASEQLVGEVVGGAEVARGAEIGHGGRVLALGAAEVVVRAF